MSTLSAIKPYHDKPMVISVYHAVFFAIVLVASLYQLSSAAKVLSLILCVGLAVYGQISVRQTGSWFVYSYALLVATLALLSAANLMDGAWTTMRENALLVRQAGIHLLLPFTALGFAALLRNVGGDMRRLAFLYIVPLTVISIPVYKLTGQAGMTDDVFIINNLYSMEVFRIFFIGALLLTVRSNVVFLVLFAADRLVCVQHAVDLVHGGDTGGADDHGARVDAPCRTGARRRLCVDLHRLLAGTARDRKQYRISGTVLEECARRDARHASCRGWIWHRVRSSRFIRTRARCAISGPNCRNCTA